MNSYIRIILVSVASIFFELDASEVRVSSIAELQTAINSAASGDVLVLANGVYVNNIISIGRVNITVRAETPGGVSLNGTNAINIAGSSVTFSGFRFTSGSIAGVVITVSGDNNVITQLSFNGYSAQKYITLQGQSNEVSYCSFENKPASAPLGNLIHIAPNGAVPNYARIRFCSFRNMPGIGGDNGNECIRIANSAQSTYICRAVIEHCYFENTGMGDSECISNKSRENIIRYNTFTNNQEAMLCFRNGDDCAAYGNFFINAGGIRVKEANNIYCYNNYFENSGAAGSQGCVRYLYYTANTVNVLKNINFIHNTFVNCGDIDLDKGAANNTWANNIFIKGAGNLFMATSTAGISWAGNMYQGTPGIAIASGMTNADPKLVMNTNGYYGVSPASPAIDASSASYPAVIDIANIDDDPFLLLDIGGTARPASAPLKDVGCSEFTATAAGANRPMKASDAGTSYLGGPATGVGGERSAATRMEPREGFALTEAYPNPFNPSTIIRYVLPAGMHVQLRIVDRLGRAVETIVDEAQASGAHEIAWNASRYPSGVYFYRLQAGQLTATKKLVFIR